MAKIVISRSQLEKLLGEAYEAGWLGSRDLKEGSVRQILDSWESRFNFERPVKKSSRENPWFSEEDRFRYLAPTLEEFTNQYQAFTVGNFSFDEDDTSQ